MAHLERKLSKCDVQQGHYIKIDLAAAGIAHARKMLAVTQLHSYILDAFNISEAFTYIPRSVESTIPKDLTRSIWEANESSVTQKEINMCASLVARKFTRVAADNANVIGLFDDPMCVGDTLKVTNGGRFRPLDGRLYVLARNDFIVENVYALFDQVAHEWGGGGLVGVAQEHSTELASRDVKSKSITPILFLCQVFDGEAMMWAEFSRSAEVVLPAALLS